MMGSSLNQYRIIATIGAGGMGEVFRARDTRLNRDVAVKVLPKHFAADARPVESLRAGSQNTRDAESSECGHRSSRREEAHFKNRREVRASSRRLLRGRADGVHRHGYWDSPI